MRVVLALIFCLAGGIQTQAQDYDPALRDWYRSLMQPDNPMMSCCGESDAYWADGVEVKDGQVIATITDDRPDAPLNRMHVPPGTKVIVPPHKLKFDRGNPTGHIVIFLDRQMKVLCYVQNGGV